MLWAHTRANVLLRAQMIESALPHYNCNLLNVTRCIHTPRPVSLHVDSRAGTQRPRGQRSCRPARGGRLTARTRRLIARGNESRGRALDLIDLSRGCYECSIKWIECCIFCPGVVRLTRPPLVQWTIYREWIFGTYKNLCVPYVLTLEAFCNLHLRVHIPVLQFISDF